MGSFKIKNRMILAKVETTEGEDALPTPLVNAIEAMEGIVNYTGTLLERNMMKQSLSPDAPIMGERNIEVQFSTELKGSGSLGVAPAISPLLQAAGFTETINASTSVVYNPTSSLMKSITIYVYEFSDDGSNALLHKATGCRGNMNVILNAGEFPVIEFQIKGAHNAATYVSIPGDDPVFEDTKGQIIQNADFSYNGNSNLVASALNVNMTNELVPIKDFNSNQGIKGYDITGRTPSGSFNPEKVALSVEDFYSNWLNVVTAAMSIDIGATSGNIVEISMPAVSIDSVGDGNIDGRAVNELPVRFNGDSGDDEVVLTFV